MPKKEKVMSTKLIAAIILLAVLCIATAAIVYTTETSSTKSSKLIVPGVHVGDTFFYNITGESVLFTSGANPDSEYPGFSDLNDTKYYEVAITGINGSIVSFSTDWVFKNGTDIQQSQTIDISNGNLGDQNGFWGIYAPNLNVNNLLCPKGGDENLIVNSTDTQTYANSTRQRNYWSIENVFTNMNDPTGSTDQDNFVGVYFDKQTGMLTTMTNVQEYNNPQMNLIITWQLTNSSVWAV